jgi:Ca2+-binding RTX toxin-like protein
MAVLALAVLTMLSFPAVAAAGDAARVGTELHYTGDGRDDRFELTIIDGQYGFDADFDGAPIAPGAGCMPDLAGPKCGTGATALVAELGAGADRARLAAALDAPPWPISTRLSGGPGADELAGGPLDDMLFGGEGDDTLRPRAGGGYVEGGEGDDLISPIAGPVNVWGGPGTDTVQFFGTGDLTVLANGAPESEHGSSIQMDIEGIVTDAGNDRVQGNHQHNTIATFAGNDHIAPGSGSDTVLAGEGDDRIEAEDGWLDPDIDCGAGHDTVVIDFIDVVAGNCEVVMREGPDADDDDVSPPADCDDNNRFIHPGVFDWPHNGVDEDCSGSDAVTPTTPPELRPNRAIVTARWRVLRRHTRVRALTVRRVPARGTVRLSCRGRGCPISARRLRVRRTRATATTLLRRARLRPGTVIELRITAPETRRKTVRYTVRANRAPRRRAT